MVFVAAGLTGPTLVQVRVPVAKSTASGITLADTNRSFVGS
jgi:hypothetical protein